LFYGGDDMKTKTYTLYVVGRHGRSWRICVPHSALALLAGLIIAFATTMTIMAKSYARMLVKVSDYDQLRADREVLSAKYRLLENVVKHTNTKLTSLESLASEVATSYGIKKASGKQLADAGVSSTETGARDSESSYTASLYTFNLIEQAALTPSHNGLLLGLLSDPEINPAHIPSIWPVYGEVTAGFGERADPFTGEDAFHPGMDIAAPYGAPVRAAADGIVLQAGPGEPGFGNIVVIDHGSGIETIYCHLSKIDAVEGQLVKQGQVVGAVGITGRTTGPHLHYEVLIHDTPVNPEKFLQGQLAQNWQLEN
jgi:murein DD-endopeptidase MepM/ murein hydrolase activator NlpD